MNRDHSENLGFRLALALWVLVALLLCGGQVGFAQDDHGDTPQTATPVGIGSITSGVLEVGGDLDYFRVQISSLATYYFFSRGNTDTRGTLFDVNLDQVTYDSSDGELDNFRIEIELLPGTYYLEVEGQYSSTVGAYHIHVEGPGAGTSSDDHGFSPWSATQINVGSITDGGLDLEGDLDYFSIEIPDLATYYFFSRNITGGDADVAARLYDANLALVTYDSSDGELDNFRIDVELLPGIYYLEVRGQYSNTIGPYHIHVEGPGAITGTDDHGSTPWSATPIAVGSITDGGIDLEGDLDYFRLQIPDLAAYYFFSRNITGGDADVAARLYDAHLDLVAYDSSDGELDNFRFDAELLPGTYYLEIRGQYSNTVGPYHIHVEGPGAGTISDDHGFTPWSATPVGGGTTTDGELDLEGDLDYFRIHAAELVTFVGETLGTTDTAGRLYDSNLDLVAYDSNDGEFDNFRIEHELQPGTYYLEIRGQYSSTTGEYQLQVEGPSSQVELSCFDGLDNDGDGLSDCADPDCDDATGSTCDTGEPGVCAQGIETCSGRKEVCEPLSEGEEESGTIRCFDGLDNDCDGLTDTTDIEYCSGQYVALGDSYSSGEGCGDYEIDFDGDGKSDSPGEDTDNNGNQCHRSVHAYPRVSRDLPSLVSQGFFACSGAVTNNVLPEVAGGEGMEDNAAPDDVPQLDREPFPEASLVTITIGGNDSKFADVLRKCRKEDDCRSHVPIEWGATGTLEQIMHSIILFQGDKIAKTIRHIRQEVGQDTRVLVLGYPNPFPCADTDDNCPVAGNPSCAELTDPWGIGKSWSEEEQKWLRTLEPTLNATVRYAANSEGAEFVSTREKFIGYEICGGSDGAKGDYFVHPRLRSSEIVGWFHPNPMGQELGYRAALEEYLVASEGTAPPPIRTDDILLASPDAGGIEASTEFTSGSLYVGVVTPSCSHHRIGPGQLLRITGSGFAPASTVTLYMEAEELEELGEEVAGADGRLEASISVPPAVADTPLVGITALGVGPGGVTHFLTATISVGPSDSSDSDSDGVSDLCDLCPDTPDPFQEDQDEDGIGDACDPCLWDSGNDVDGDGLCSDVDPCPYEFPNDKDGDGLCASVDNCPGVSNPDQADADNDFVGDACDVCLGYPDFGCLFSDGVESGDTSSWSKTVQ